MSNTHDTPCQGGCGKLRSVLYSDSPKDWLCNECRTKPGRSRKLTFDIYWAPEGRCIATVQVVTARKAIRLAPMPYRRYLGEMYTKVVIDVDAKCNVEETCPRHGEY